MGLLEGKKQVVQNDGETRANKRFVFDLYIYFVYTCLFIDSCLLFFNLYICPSIVIVLLADLNSDSLRRSPVEGKVIYPSICRVLHTSQVVFLPNFSHQQYC